MEVATTNNHSQSHHHHHHHHHRLGNANNNSSSSNVSVGGGSGSGARSPFQREVREWQRIDPDTGALFSGRLEADRWINGPLNSYGKISDSQNISQPNGTQHTQRKQLEVLRTANGAMQVIRTQTVQKTSSTTRHWSATSSSSTTTTRSSNAITVSPAMTSMWAPKPSQGVDICELSDDDRENDDHDYHGSDAGVAIVSENESPSAARPSLGHSNGYGNDYGQELVDDHVDFVVINGHADDDVDDVEDDDDVAHLHKLGHNLLPDTAPSLKLSNLMKSSSSISSQSSNNSNLTTATVAGNTHRNAGKISLHAIVGQTAAAVTTTAATSSSSSSSLSSWAKRLGPTTEQADLYGQGNNNSSKRRVGVTTEAAGDADVSAAAAAGMGTPTQRRDLESFRHYNDDAAVAADDDDDLRLSARHQRRQQVSQSVYAPPLPASFGSVSGSLQRSRSISTDDLSNDWQQTAEEEEDLEQPCGDWRRVSKLRRSFQSQDYHKVTNASVRPRPRPLDLPSSSVSVARIRAELENGRRLNTAMRNNHVDLAALDSILNPSTGNNNSSSNDCCQSFSKPQVAKRSTFLTAESLQEIRGKLKKLSDESLYKEDFLAHQAVAKPAQVEVLQSPDPVPAAAAPSAFRAVHNTHSLETRQRPKDTSSSEWHLRRKSYGFEKMSPPESRSIFRVDASTDSGLGRSGEQLGNWSPTERSAAAANGPGSTIIHFGRQQSNTPDSPNEAELSKRHSIAVEETWRDIRKTSQVRVNGESVNGSSNNSSSSQLQRGSAQKRVEFCKTEVHFAAESGRVNIVETDGKPPPTQNFRRRRRTASGPLQSLVKSASVSTSTTTTSSITSSSNVTHFGDDPTIRSKPITSSTVAYRATLIDPPEVVSQPVAGTQVTVITAKPTKPALEPRYSLLESTSTASRHSYTSTSGVDTTDNETDELANIRGILKNKPIKPKPYHLGENIESADVLWSVPVTMKSDRESSPPNRESATSGSGDSPITTKSVAERVRIVEQRQYDKQQLQQQPSPAGNGYSTKINVSLGASDEWTETGGSSGRRRSSAQELLLQDLRAHQRILDEGLKSTSLIMKTMRSASEFDEAMRRLSIASIESALIQPTIVVPTPMLRSHSYQEESSRRTSTTSITSSDLFGSALYDSLPRSVPLAPPRLKLLGNTQIPVSQQLTQLRRLYDAADQEEDSADEEVKRYFRESNHSNSDSGGGTQCSSSPEDVVLKGSEYSSSWSRMKAKRTIWKIEAQEQTLKRADLPKSNVMNIALHAPRLQKPKATPPTLRIGQLVPVAKPRTLLVQPQPPAQVIQQPVDNGNESGSDSLKIVKETRGARKLREHELAYFGVQQSPTPTHSPKLQATPSNPRRTLPTRSKHSHDEATTQKSSSSSSATTAATTTTTKWQLLNDRPDLLRHSPQGNDDTTTMSNDYPDNDDDIDDEHCYENIANELTTTFRVKSPSPGSYERKADLQRDAQILSEMTRNADQTLKALSDEAAFKDQRRRSCSLQRRSAKPLATIDEKVKGDAKALSVARSTFASEARRNSRQSTPSPTRARSSSQSSIECCPRDRSRSSSRESMTHGGGSSDEQLSKQRIERLLMRTPKREKSRHDPAEQRSSRQSSSSKPRVAAESTKRSSHHHSRHREKENTAGEHSSGKHSSGTVSSSTGTRLLRSSRVTEETRPRISSQRASERDRERERSRNSEKHREELTRSRGHSSRSRHSEQTQAGHKSSKSSSRSHHEHTSTTSSAHRKSTTASKATTAAAATTTTAGSTTRATSTTTSHKATAATTTTTAPTATTAHNELTHGKSTLNGHHHHHQQQQQPQHHHSHHHQHHSSSGSKHHGGQPPQHHVHSLTTTTIAATKHQRDRHGKDRK